MSSTQILKTINGKPFFSLVSCSFLFLFGQLAYGQVVVVDWEQADNKLGKLTISQSNVSLERFISPHDTLNLAQFSFSASEPITGTLNGGEPKAFYATDSTVNLDFGIVPTLLEAVELSVKKVKKLKLKNYKQKINTKNVNAFSKASYGFLVPEIEFITCVIPDKKRQFDLKISTIDFPVKALDKSTRDSLILRLNIYDDEKKIVGSYEKIIAPDFKSDHLEFKINGLLTMPPAGLCLGLEGLPVSNKDYSGELYAHPNFNILQFIFSQFSEPVSYIRSSPDYSWLEMYRFNYNLPSYITKLYYIPYRGKYFDNLNLRFDMNLVRD